MSISAIAVGTAALLIILSVFNGFEGFIKSLYNSFYPEIKITAVEGKTFEARPALIQNIKKIDGVETLSMSLEDRVLFTFGNNQSIAVLKGIDKNYDKVSKIKESVDHGTMDFSGENSRIPPAVFGMGIANKLGITDRSMMPVSCFAFRNTQSYNLDVLSAYNQQEFHVQGVFYLQEEMDEKFVFAPLEQVQLVLGREKAISSIELSLDPNSSAESVRTKIQKKIGTKLKAETRYEQNKTLYFILKSERWATFAILALMLVIASFNIVGSLSMLVLEKRKDSAILRTMGADQKMIRRIFLATGILLSCIGALIGMLIAFIVCFAQKKFGFVRLDGSDNLLIDAYPVDMHLFDFVLVLLTVVLFAFLASVGPAKKAAANEIQAALK